MHRAKGFSSYIINISHLMSVIQYWKSDVVQRKKLTGSLFPVTLNGKNYNVLHISPKPPTHFLKGKKTNKQTVKYVSNKLHVMM